MRHLYDLAWYVFAGVQVLVMWGTQVGPKQVVSHSAEWASTFGIRNPPEWLRSLETDRVIRHISAILLLSWLVPTAFSFVDMASLFPTSKYLFIVAAVCIAIGIALNLFQPAWMKGIWQPNNLAALGAIIVLGALIWGWFFQQIPTQQNQADITDAEKTTIAKAQVEALKQQILALQAPTSKREFTTKTIRDLRSFYVGRTRLQADAFIADDKGKLIEAEGSIVNVDPGMVMLQTSTDVFNGMVDYVECRFEPDWNAKLGTYRTGEHMKIRGVIAPSQNGAQIYLQECEIITQSGSVVKAAQTSTAYPNSILIARYYSKQNKEAVADILDKTSDVISKKGEDIFAMAEEAINRSAWDRPGENIQPMIDRLLRIEALTADFRRDLFEGLYKQYPDYRVEINNLIFPAEPAAYFERGAKDFKNALTVWNEHRTGLEGNQRQEFVQLVNTARSAFAGFRQEFLKWTTERTAKIDQTRKALQQ